MQGHGILIVALVLSAGLSGCLNFGEGPGPSEVQPAPQGEGLDLDSKLASEQLRPGWELVLVNLAPAQAQPIIELEAWTPWFATPQQFVHSSILNSTQMVSLTQISVNGTTTNHYQGPFSGSGDAILPSADTERGIVYFTDAPVRGEPHLVRRNLTPGGDETVVGTLPHEDRPTAPWTVSPDGSRIATSVETDLADGPVSQMIVYNFTGGTLGEPIRSISGGDEPRFLSDSHVVLARRGDPTTIGILNIDDGRFSPLVQENQGGTPWDPVIAGDWIWFRTTQFGQDEDGQRDEVRRVNLDGERLERVVVSEDYRFGRFDVAPTEDVLVMEVRERG